VKEPTLNQRIFFRKIENIKEPELKVIWFLSFFKKEKKAKGSLISKI
jgi:hypothetical protein